jgi:transcriptional regulator with XRE-family HTH domain
VARRRTFAERRRALGYSQEALAEKLGIDRTTVGRWERGETDPYPHVRPKLCRVLEVGAGELDALLGSREAGTRTGVSLAPDGNSGEPAFRDARSRPVFVQYLNPEVLGCYGLRILGSDNRVLLASAIRSSRLAALATDAYLLVPASCMFEVPNSQEFLRATEPLIRAGALRYAASVPDLEAYRESKVPEYREEPANPYIGNAPAIDKWRSSFLAEPRRVSTTASDIGHEWSRGLSPGGPLHGIQQSLIQRRQGREAYLARELQSAPKRLHGRAFIGRNVRKATRLRFSDVEALRLDFFLSRAYLASYLTDFDANLLTDPGGRDLSCGLGADGQAHRGRLISASTLNYILKVTEIHRFVYYLAEWDDLLAFRAAPELAFLTLFAFKDHDLYEVRRAAVKANAAGFRPASSLSMALSNVQRFADTILQQSP